MESNMSFLDRMENELLQLKLKLDKLTAFMTTEKFKELSVVQRNLMVDQQYHMSKYYEILDKRIKDVKLNGGR